MRKLFASMVAIVAVLATGSAALAEQPWTLGDNVRYMSIGDSFAAGKGAIPVTRGFAYVLYQEGVFAPITDTTFANSAVPGSLSVDVLTWQVPAAIKSFKPHVVTVMVGGNDLQRVLGGASPSAVLAAYGQNLAGILCGLKNGISPSPLVIAANQPDFPWLTEMNPQVRVLIMAMNQVTSDVAQACDARVADVFTAFDGRTGLFLHDRNGAAPNEGHPTNLGYRVIADAFKAAANP
jgi:lysophospholipase L1-like esterase